jgi:HEAT repeat protein
MTQNRVQGAGVLWLALALLPGCSSQPKSAAGPQLTPLSQIDPALADLWRTYLQSGDPGGAERWQRARAAALSDPKAVRFLADNLGREMVVAFDTEGAFEKASRGSKFLRARSEMVALQSAAVPLLLGMVREGDDIIARLGGDVLADIGAPAGPELVSALETLDQGSPRWRRRLTELLLRLPPLGASDAFLVLELERLAASEPDLQARAYTIEALGLRAGLAGEGSRVAPDLVRYLDDSEPLVAGRAARALGHAADPRAARDLIRLLERALRSGDATLRRDAEFGLKTLASRQERPWPNPAPRSPDAWREYWGV